MKALTPKSSCQTWRRGCWKRLPCHLPSRLLARHRQRHHRHVQSPCVAVRLVTSTVNCSPVCLACFCSGVLMSCWAFCSDRDKACCVLSILLYCTCTLLGLCFWNLSCPRRFCNIIWVACIAKCYDSPFSLRCLVAIVMLVVSCKREWLLFINMNLWLVFTVHQEWETSQTCINTRGQHDQCGTFKTNKQT